MSRMAKRAILATIRDRYRASSRKDKSRILDEFIAVAGHHRKHGIRLLGRPVGGADQRPNSKGRRIYDEAIRETANASIALPPPIGAANDIPLPAARPQIAPPTCKRRRRAAQLALERQLLTICQPFSDDSSAVQAKLCRRIKRPIKELFVFAAERSLRHLVVSRKVSGGIRSERGRNSKMTLASLFGT